MPRQTKTILKSYFETGDKPTQRQFEDLIDSMVSDGFAFMGIAVPITNPGTPDQKMAYIAVEPGTYTNFDGINVTEDEVVVLYYDTEWHKEATGIASQAKLTELGQYVDNPEWVMTVTDANDRILYGVKIDGKFYFGDGCPPQVVEYITNKLGSYDASDYADIKTFLGNLIDGDTLTTLLNAKLNAEGLDPDALGTVQAVENPEYIQVITDSEDKILEGISSEGVKQINLPIDTPSATMEHIDNSEWLEVKTDKDGNIVFGIDKKGITHANIAKSEELLTPQVKISGLIPSAPNVQALKGNDAPIAAAEYDQFNDYINLWDSLLNRANQYGTYVRKCWIDGVAYDNSNRIMSDLPTSGAHNPRNDMNQYPLIMYKFIPDLYAESFKNKPNTKKVLIVSGIHGGSSGGDHWESPMAVYYFAKRLVEEFYLTDSLTHLREFVEFDFVPAANPWGLNNLQRLNGQGIDINRDFADFVTVTGQQIKSLVDNGNYDLFWDSHCLGGTSLTEGDLAGANFYWIASGSIERCIGLQMLDYIGAKYSLKTGIMSVVAKSAAWYSYINHKTTISTEIPANTPLYYGDTIGDVHGEEVMKRGADFIQNAFATTCNLLLKNIV